MDKEHLGRALEQASWRAKLDEVYDIRSRQAEFRAMIQAQGKELAQRYLSCAEGFQQIFQITTDLRPDRSDTLTTPPINLGEYEDSNWGYGMMEAKLSARSYSRCGAFDTETNVIFITTSGKKIGIASEHFWSVSHALSGGSEFLEEGYNWIGAGGLTGIGRAESRHVDRAWTELMPVIRSAEETHAMVWEAINNRSLNPDFVQRAANFELELSAQRR